MRQFVWFLARGVPFHVVSDNTLARLWQAFPGRLSTVLREWAFGTLTMHSYTL